MARHSRTQLSLQPLINIGRLLARGGDPAAHQYFQGLFDTVAARADVTIEGIEMNCSRLTRDDVGHREIVRWLWPVMVSDGTRALTSAGRWTEALTHLQRHNGIDERMLDGRQVLILSHCMAHDYEAAHAALPADAPTAWENAIARYLETLNLTLVGDQPGTAVAQLADAYAQPGVTEQPVTFRTALTSAPGRWLREHTTRQRLPGRPSVSSWTPPTRTQRTTWFPTRMPASRDTTRNQDTHDDRTCRRG